MIFKGRLRDRARAIESEAGALIEKYAHGAHDVARDMERQANDLGTTIFWHAVRKVILARNKSEVRAEVLPPMRTGNCISCLVEKFSGTNGGGPHLRDCASCLTQRIRGSSPDLKLDLTQLSTKALLPTCDPLLEHSSRGE